MALELLGNGSTGNPIYIKNSYSYIIALHFSETDFPKEFLKLEAQSTESVSLTSHFITNFPLIWPNDFREDFLNWPITNKNCLWWPF